MLSLNSKIVLVRFSENVNKSTLNILLRVNPPLKYKAFVKRIKQSIALNVINGVKDNILHANFVYNTRWDDSYLGTYQ